MSTKNLMFKLTWSEIDDYLKENDVILFPVGSTEQHGKHIAVDNDVYVAYEVAKRVAEKTNVLVAPALPIGNSIHHMNFPGTITFTFYTLVRVYKEACKSLLHHGFKKIVILNGHGGNNSAIEQALREIREETGRIVYAISAFFGLIGRPPEVQKMVIQKEGGHACEMETSISLYFDERVLMDKAEDWTLPQNTSDFDRKYFFEGSGRVVAARDWHEKTELGSLGLPTKATIEKGKTMMEPVIASIVEFIEDLKAR